MQKTALVNLAWIAYGGLVAEMGTTLCPKSQTIKSQLLRSDRHAGVHAQNREIIHYDSRSMVL